MVIHARVVGSSSWFFRQGFYFLPELAGRALHGYFWSMPTLTQTTATQRHCQAGDSDHIGHAHQRYNLWGNPRSAADSLLVVRRNVACAF